MSEPDTLPGRLLDEMARVRDRVLPHYTELGVIGQFGAAMIQADLDYAKSAIAVGDAVAMLKAYATLKETQA